MRNDQIYKKGRIGCLLVHGFTGSPNELVELGEFLSNQKITVFIPTLPGHGTHSGDLFNYTWKDWFACVKDSYEVLAKGCSDVFVIGLSMGGTLALHLAAHRPVTGVVSLAAAIEFQSWQKTAVRKLYKFKKYRYKRGGEDVRDKAAKSQLGSYQRYPLYAADQFFQLLDHVRDDLAEITQPILIVHSKQDHTVAFSNSEIIYDSVSSKNKTKVDLENSYHIITVDVEKEKVKKEVLNFIQANTRIEAEKPPPLSHKRKVKRVTQAG